MSRSETPDKAFKTAQLIEANKPLGIFNNQHINITPTYKGKDKFFNYSKFKISNNLGKINVKIKITNNENAKSVPGFYKIDGKYNDKNLSFLRTNFFFFSLVKKNNIYFNVNGDLIEESVGSNKRYGLSLENWENYKTHCMNL